MVIDESKTKQGQTLHSPSTIFQFFCSEETFHKKNISFVSKQHKPIVFCEGRIDHDVERITISPSYTLPW